MTPDQALDAAIRDARHLLFAFNGPICRTGTADPADPTAPTTPYIHEAVAACHESGRSIVVISIKPKIDVPAYLDAHNLFEPITVITASVADAVNFLEASPADCLLVTSSPADIEDAEARGTSSIGYAQTRDDAAHLIDAGAIAFAHSIAEIALSLRAHRLPPESL
jgi:beta-phosphoglucomutase-like phosphatase (HAD superfamily)